MLRILVLVLVVVSVSVGALACGDRLPLLVDSGHPDSTVHAVVVFPSNATVKIGERVQLGAAVDAGPGVTERSVAWSSSNATIATVSAAGLVTPGTVTGGVTITAASKADTSVKGTSAIIVNAAGSP